MKFRQAIQSKFSIILFLVLVFGVSSIARAAPGDVDATFNAGTFEPGGDQARIRAMAVQPDGKIIIAGFFTSIGGAAHNKIARLNADGSLDASFAPDVNSSIYAVALQADGKILIGGDFFQVNGTMHNSIARLNADGSVDASFNTDVDGTVYAIILQPDGKILFGGNIGSVNNSPRYNVTRLSTDGMLDTSFSPGFFDGVPGFVYALALQPDGKVLVGGYFDRIGGVSRIHFARYNSNGSLDTAFNPILSFDGSGVRAIVLQTDGKFLIGGGLTSVNGTPRDRIARLNGDGSLDASFAPSGFLNLTEIFAIRPQADGRILIGGFFFYGQVPQYRHSIARLNADGSRDTSFNTIFNFTNGREGVFAIVRQCGRILIGGQFAELAAAPPRQKIARLIDNPSKTSSDFDGDGCADLSVYRPSNGTWYSSRSTQGFSAQQFGISTDKPASADYDGDGRSDVAVWREGSFAYFYILQSSDNTFRFEQFGQTGDVLTVGDWDGDGRADTSVYRDSAVGSQSYFYYRGSLNNPNGNVTYLPWGTSGDKPMRGDFDGDGKRDLAVFRPSINRWLIRPSSNGSIVRYENWGLASDTFVPADYDGDGATDLAIFRSGVWYILQSSDAMPHAENWGLSSDKLVPADYDGDGKTDVAVYRSGIWYIKNSTGGINYGYFGLNSDIPINQIQ